MKTKNENANQTHLKFLQEKVCLDFILQYVHKKS